MVGYCSQTDEANGFFSQTEGAKASLEERLIDILTPCRQ